MIEDNGDYIQYAHKINYSAHNIKLLLTHLIQISTHTHSSFFAQTSNTHNNTHILTIF